MNNRGISPIIATILLITMVVALAGIVTIWVNSESQNAMMAESERRERVMDRKSEEIQLIAIDITTDSLTLINIGTSDSIVTYITVNDTYFSLNPVEEIAIGDSEIISHPNLLPNEISNLHRLEIGTALGNVFLYSSPSAAIKIENTFFSYNNRLVVFDGSHSFDSDGSITLWEWDLDYDGNPANFNIDATGNKISHAFSASGNYTIGLRVTDDIGMVSIVSIDMIIP